ncbi:2'-5' RNA ligase family protein [Streptomyces luteireticuli]|uniref:2'-5' RNA ligase family protein n=1 Tax=Streptomyces luteireticuli TaxID=173858 RepID=UPI003555E3BE
MDSFFDEVTNRRYPYPAFRKDLHWHLTVDTALIHRKLVDPYRELTHRPGIAPVEAQWAHITLLHGQPLDDLAPGQAEKIAEIVTGECEQIAPFDVTLDRPSVGRVAIECPGRPGAPARRLWDLTARAGAEVTQDNFPRIPASYYPHLSLGYGSPTPTQRADRAELKAWLSDCPYGPVTLRITSLSLVAQWHTGQYIHWDHLATIPLAGEAPPC